MPSRRSAEQVPEAPSWLVRWPRAAASPARGRGPSWSSRGPVSRTRATARSRGRRRPTTRCWPSWTTTRSSTRAGTGRWRQRWDEAPPDVACIGGPIRPRFDTPPPPWFSDAIRHVLTLLDRGPEVRDLDPGEEAVYGANISFRGRAAPRGGRVRPGAGPQRRAGCSSARRTRRSGRWCGWATGSATCPTRRSCHVIPAERLPARRSCERRFKFGVALGMRGGRARGLLPPEVALAGARRHPRGAGSRG